MEYKPKTLKREIRKTLITENKAKRPGRWEGGSSDRKPPGIKKGWMKPGEVNTCETLILKPQIWGHFLSQPRNFLPGYHSIQKTVSRHVMAAHRKSVNRNTGSEPVGALWNGEEAEERIVVTRKRPTKWIIHHAACGFMCVPGLLWGKILNGAFGSQADWW